MGNIVLDNDRSSNVGYESITIDLLSQYTLCYYDNTIQTTVTTTNVPSSIPSNQPSYQPSDEPFSLYDNNSSPPTLLPTLLPTMSPTKNETSGAESQRIIENLSTIAQVVLIVAIGGAILLTAAAYVGM